jgi:hypothetical protein
MDQIRCKVVMMKFKRQGHCCWKEGWNRGRKEKEKDMGMGMDMDMAVMVMKKLVKNLGFLGVAVCKLPKAHNTFQEVIHGGGD